MYINLWVINLMNTRNSFNLYISRFLDMVSEHVQIRVISLSIFLLCLSSLIREHGKQRWRTFRRGIGCEELGSVMKNIVHGKQRWRMYYVNICTIM